MRALPLALMILLAPSLALAHPGHGDDGFLTGILHPLTGVDHLLAMLAVGLWAGASGGRARWAFPVAFLGAMALAGLMGAGGAEFGAMEHVILASVIALGAAAAFALRLPMALSLSLLAVFGAAHGWAHGVEGPGGSVYALGFLIATAGLHGLGLGLARLGLTATRSLGAGVALGGALLAVI